MKNILVLLLLSFSAYSQFQKSGKIYFKESIKLNIQISEENKEMAKMMPTSQDTYKVLFYNSNESLFKIEEKKNEDLDIKHEEGGNQMRMVFKVPQTTIYQNLSENNFVQSQEFLDKEFLIVDQVNDKKWKVTGEQKKVLDFVCIKATLVDTSQKVVAWFTPQIPVGMGPNGYSGLPGMILALDTDNGQRLIAATKIEALPAGFVFTQPEKGKKVSKAEFKKIRDDKMKEMGSDGKGGVRMIIRNEN
ncbi:GLPGLI family protein [Lacihabitans soyangensis]|uniref:GLPGLI family protein n=1 Tax=Lacihabitans soyangensis TaxID=869394 RepID=A0AAE3H4L8_9BACT|nr:GLPGLI family protein [Lacihabitans soyangensis]MCP9763801.1 GLPGLI family protein [Lacihabitans soyangensis]